MRKNLGLVLLGVGAFLLVVALICVVWAPGQLMKTPLDTDSTTRLSGQADKLNPAKGEVESLDVRATSFTQAAADDSDDDVIVWVNTTCLVVVTEGGPDCGVEGTGENADPNVISITREVFASDRRTGEAVNDAKYLPEDGVVKDGLVNKFPFETEKQDYEFWDGILDRTVTAEYQGTEYIHGVETYEFHYAVSEEPAVVTGDIEGLYSMDKTMWIEPLTGAIINQEQHEVRTLANGDVLLDMHLAFTEEQVKENASSAKENVSSLRLVTKTVPLVGFIGGPVLLLLGAGLVLTARRSGGARAAD